MATTQHSTLTGSELHEPKGVATAGDNEAYISDSGSGAWKKVMRTGWWDYNDLTTATTPIALTFADTDYELTNDGAGAYTVVSYGLPEITNIWDTATDRFDFSGLTLGDTIDIRLDVDMTTSSNNTAVSLGIEFDVGGTPFTLNLLDEVNIKNTGSHHLTINMPFYIGSIGVRDNPARVLASADDTGVTVEVHGWFVRAIVGNE